MNNMGFENIKITKKSGTKEDGYIYAGVLTYIIKERNKGLLKRVFSKHKHTLKRIRVNFIANNRKNVYHPILLSDATGDDDVLNPINKDLLRYEKEYKTLIARILPIGENIKSEDECCCNPDIVKGEWYYKHDILLGYLLNKKDTEVINYHFKSDFKWYIDFKYKGYLFYYYDIVWKDISRIYQKACLNCSTCDNSEEEYFLKEFDIWLEGEYNKRQREQMAKDICCNKD